MRFAQIADELLNIDGVGCPLLLAHKINHGKKGVDVNTIFGTHFRHGFVAKSHGNMEAVDDHQKETVVVDNISHSIGARVG